MNFPIVKKVAAGTIADQLQSVQPDLNGPPVRRTYKNHMGSTVTEYMSGSRSIHSYESTNLYGDYGHAFLRGYFVVDENGTMIFMGDERYEEIRSKCIPYWKILKQLQETFKGYNVEPSRGQRLAVNDKIMKGFLFHPGMLRTTENMDIEAEIEKTVEFIAKEIQIDIDRGRIVKGEYGVE